MYYFRNGIHVRQQGIVETDEYLRFEAIISNSNLDSYYTIMDPETTLPNFVEDLKAGVMFLDSHRTDRLGYAQSVDGRMEDNNDVIGVFEVAKNINFGGELTFASTNDFINGIIKRLVRDVSVGFKDGRYICNIDGKPIYGTGCCEHWPGQTYNIDGKEILCTATIVDARLSEVSAVHDGATAGAGVLRKIEDLHSKGQLSNQSIGSLAYRYNVEYDINKRVFIPTHLRTPGVKPSGDDKQEDNDMDAKEVRGIVEEVLKTALEPVTTGIKANADALVKQSETLETLGSQVSKSERAQLEIEAAEESVRAFGAEKDAEKTKRFLSNLETIEDVRETKDEWKAIADAKFKAGRSTSDPDTDDDDNENGGNDKNTARKKLSNV